jgi:predicted SnoaL-like aldol condensation-catalyzing enzyme
MKPFVAAVAAIVMLGSASLAQAAETAQETANKAVVLKFWSEVFDHHDWTRAKLYMADGYIQHNPLAATGRAGFEAYFSKAWPQPLPADKVKPTHFDVVMAEGDLVTLIQRVPRPDPDHPGQTYNSFWFDTLRVKDGKLVEHWDNALKGSNVPPPSALN